MQNTMQAARLLSEKDKDGRHEVQVAETAVPPLAQGRREALVRVEAAALNHRENWMAMGMYPNMHFGVILGSDACGIVAAVSDESDGGWVAQRVIIDPSCDEKKFSILGMPLDGTFAEFVRVPIQNLRPAPPHLDAAHAAAIPLAGGTAYRALVTKGGVKPGDAVLVTGIGGGVALFALQFALALGCRVYVTSSSAEKLQKAAQLGACFGVDYKKEGWEAALKERVMSEDAGFDCVVDGAGGSGLKEYVTMMKQGGRIVAYGVTAGALETSFVMPDVFLNNIDIRGTAMYSPQEFTDMVALINRAKLVPVVDIVMPLAKAKEAIDRMRRANQFGKIILAIEHGDEPAATP